MSQAIANCTIPNLYVRLQYCAPLSLLPSLPIQPSFPESEDEIANSFWNRWLSLFVDFFSISMLLTEIGKRLAVLLRHFFRLCLATLSKHTSR